MIDIHYLKNVYYLIDYLNFIFYLYFIEKNFKSIINIKNKN